MKIPITQADLSSENDFRFIEAVTACNSGDPETCTQNGKCSFGGDCFDSDKPFKNKTNEELLKLLDAKDSEIKALYELSKSLLSKIHKLSTDLTYRYLVGLRQEDKKVFMVKSINGELEGFRKSGLLEIESIMSKFK